MSAHTPRDIQNRYEGSLVPVSAGGIEIIIIDAIVGFTATVWTGLRFYSRRMKKTQTYPEDYVVLLALLMLYGFILDSILMVFVGGFGHHLTELRPYHVERCLKLGLGSQFLFAFAVGLVKLSICLMLSRIFFVHLLKIAARVAMGFAVVWAVVTILIGFLICQPLSMNWNPATPGGHCGDEDLAFAAGGLVDVLSDLFILILPIPMVIKLRVPQANKIGLVCIFGAGILTMITGILRVVVTLSIDFTDFTFAAKGAHIWSVTEIGVSIVVASSPMLRPLFDKVFHTVASFTNVSRTELSCYSIRPGGSSAKSVGFVEVGDQIALKDLCAQRNVVESRTTASTVNSRVFLDECHSQKEADVEKGFSIGTIASP
ncbi:hypothetical protein AOQ84DRAFT_384022 [Glonium stellatum]|uniref:Rhodopsin domain-containing protein n=1 Tax=Glonium stellatum TaxID=574774 RepID=A0A8E2K0D3_9PEZI|nr:hypothetical protein AOQ84DRAFT_384022 [Glonium stellatum]